MPIYKSHTIFNVARGAKAFLSLRAGVTRGEVQDPDEAALRNQSLKRQLAERDQRLQRHKEQLEQRDQRLQRLKEQLKRRDQRIQQLKSSGSPGKAKSVEENPAGRKKAPGQPGRILYNGIALPPKNIRPCGKNLQDDEFYLSSARREADHLVQSLGLNPESSLLDVGSGPGRLAIGILENLGRLRKYRGMDVSEKSIRWGQHYVTPRGPNFQFLHVNAENTRYNPQGEKIGAEFKLPFEGGEFDIICVYSVFSHMLTDDVRAYLEEFRRILRPEGRVCLTAFLEEGVPDVTENPEDYKGKDWTGPLHCVRYNKDFFEGLLDENGLQIDGFDTEKVGFQRRVYVSRRG